jgi:hypothetical protein
LIGERGSKTVLRTIRIPKDLDSILQQDAKRNRLSFNSHILRIMTRYSDWDRFNERWGIISLKRDVFRSILEVVEPDKLASAAMDVGSHIPKEFISFWFKKINLDTYLQYLSLVCQYAKFAECEIDNDGKDYTIILSHDLGQKWSDFLAVCITEGLKVTTGVLAKTDTTRNSVIVRFHVGSNSPVII